MPVTPTGTPSRVQTIGLITDSNVLWATTQDRLVLIDRVARHPIAEYGDDSGIGGGNHAGAGSVTIESTTFIGSERGVTVVQRDAIRSQRTGDVEITGVAVEAKRVATKRLSAAQHVELSTGDRNIEFEFTDFHPSGGPRRLLEYRMAGFDREWIRAGGSVHSARYSNLPAGDLRFEVRSADATSPYSPSDVASVEVAVEGPWWTEPTALVAAMFGIFSLVAVIAVSRDREARRRRQELESLVSERTAELKTAAEEIEAVSESKSRLLSAISHDLRTPLTSILGYSELMSASPELSESTARWAENARSAALHLNALIDELSEMARFEALAVKLEVAPTNLREVLEHTIDLCEASDGARESATATRSNEPHEINLEVDSALSQSYLADAVKLTRALVNLVSNAIYHGAGSEIVLSVGLIESPTADVDRLRFAVTDHGPGIPSDKLTTIFEPFERLHGYDRNRLGLGLSIAKQIVQRLGGTLEVTSVPEVATTFSFDLDLAVVAGHEVARPIRVLVLEDNASVRQVFEDQLAMLGAEAVVVGHSSAAFDEMSVRNFDLVLVDHHLDGELGADAALRIRGMPGHETVPVVCVTANPAEAERFAAYDRVVSKPVRVGDLRRVVADVSHDVLGGRNL
jgi:signal transduction histidine kinase